MVRRRGRRIRRRFEGSLCCAGAGGSAAQHQQSAIHPAPARWQALLGRDEAALFAVPRVRARASPLRSGSAAARPHTLCLTEPFRGKWERMASWRIRRGSLPYKRTHAHGRSPVFRAPDLAQAAVDARARTSRTVPCRDFASLRRAARAGRSRRVPVAPRASSPRGGRSSHASNRLLAGLRRTALAEVARAAGARGICGGKSDSAGARRGAECGGRAPTRFRAPAGRSAAACSGPSGNPCVDARLRGKPGHPPREQGRCSGSRPCACCRSSSGWQAALPPCPIDAPGARQSPRQAMHPESIACSSLPRRDPPDGDGERSCASFPTFSSFHLVI